MPKALPRVCPTATRLATARVAAVTTTTSPVPVQTAWTSPSSSARTNRAVQPISTSPVTASVATSITASAVRPPNAPRATNARPPETPMPSGWSGTAIRPATVFVVRLRITTSAVVAPVA